MWTRINPTYPERIRGPEMGTGAVHSGPGDSVRPALHYSPLARDTHKIVQLLLTLGSRRFTAMRVTMSGLWRRQKISV